MKKAIKIAFFIIVGIIVLIVGYTYFFDNEGNTRVDNDFAEQNADARYLTIINDTGAVLNGVHIYVGEGTEIEQCYQENPEENSFSVEIPSQYEEYRDFVVQFVTNHELIYAKKVSNVKKEGRTEVRITESDYQEQEGDWKRTLDRWFNND